MTSAAEHRMLWLTAVSQLYGRSQWAMGFYSRTISSYIFYKWIREWGSCNSSVHITAPLYLQGCLLLIRWFMHTCLLILTLHCTFSILEMVGKRVSKILCAVQMGRLAASGLKTSPRLLWLFTRTMQCLFYCEAPEMFCGLRNITWLSISMGVRHDDGILLLGKLFL